MPNTLAFFPWLTTETVTEIAGIRLTPYRRRRLPGDKATASQTDVDGIIAAYARRKNVLVDRALLLEVGDWRSGQEANADVVKELFRVRELLAFCGLAHRQLFRRDQYSNFDTFALTVQSFQANSPGAFSFTVRRRDYGTTHLWDADEFAFLKPLHVEDGARLFFSPALFDSLRRADLADAAPFSAIVEFNRANTDGDVPLHTELVMMKSAFEYLLDIDHHAENFVEALLPLVPAFTSTDKYPCPGFELWAKRFPKSTRPLESWAREFCVQRNEAGHGARRGGDHHVWSQDAHLAFASMLLPKLVQFLLAQRGFFTPTETDSIHREWTEAYLGFDPFAPVPTRQRDRAREHEWSRIISEGVVGEKLRRRMRAELDRIMPDEKEE
jgi:hypothetical protein